MTTSLPSFFFIITRQLPEDKIVAVYSDFSSCVIMNTNQYKPFSKLAQWSVAQNASWKSETTTKHMSGHKSDCKIPASQSFLPQAGPKKPFWASRTAWDIYVPVWLHRAATSSQEKHPMIKIWCFCPHSQQILLGFCCKTSDSFPLPFFQFS